MELRNVRAARARGLSLPALVAIAIVCTATVSGLIWNAYEWTMSTSVSRALVDSDDPVEQRAAVVRMLRDSSASIATLQRVANGADAEVAEQARLALLHIHRASAR